MTKIVLFLTVAVNFIFAEGSLDELNAKNEKFTTTNEFLRDFEKQKTRDKLEDKNTSTSKEQSQKTLEIQKASEAIK